MEIPGVTISERRNLVGLLSRRWERMSEIAQRPYTRRSVISIRNHNERKTNPPGGPSLSSTRHVGDEVDARDRAGKWYPSIIREIGDMNNDHKNSYKIHFIGWNIVYDEWIHESEGRIARRGRFQRSERAPRLNVSVRTETKETVVIRGWDETKLEDSKTQTIRWQDIITWSSRYSSMPLLESHKKCYHCNHSFTSNEKILVNVGNKRLENGNLSNRLYPLLVHKYCLIAHGIANSDLSESLRNMRKIFVENNSKAAVRRIMFLHYRRSN